MKKGIGSLRQIVADLGIDAPIIKGEKIPIRKCWHFSTDGNYVDYLFCDEEDFVDGMNRIYIVVQKFKVIILAFCLMDNHVHFILYGDFDECNRFMHEYVRRTSMHITNKHGDKHKLADVPINHQVVDDDRYLKTAICYVIKNPSQAGLPYNAYDYPWSSGSLYMRPQVLSMIGSNPSAWTLPHWTSPDYDFCYTSDMSARRKKSVMKTNNIAPDNVRMIGDLVFPGEYVASEIVQMIFKTHKSFNYFMCVTKDSDVESRGGIISRLSIPDQEMRQIKASVCMELFGVETVRSLTTDQRLKLTRTLRHRYSSSPKQLVKMCGLKYDEVKDLL